MQKKETSQKERLKKTKTEAMEDMFEAISVEDSLENSMESHEEASEDTGSSRREERRRRRVRNQLFAYIILLTFIVLIGTGCIFSIRYILKDRTVDSPDEGVEEHLESIISDEIEIQEPDPSEFIPELTEEEKLDEIINAAIEVMPLEDKVAGLFMVKPEDITGVSKVTQAGEGTKDALNQYPVGGIVYFKQNIKSGQQLQEMINNTTLYSRYPLFIGVDEEGGSVTRVAGSGLAQDVGKAADIGASGDASKAYEAGASIAGYLSPFGFNLNFAPVADIRFGDHSIIGNRSYGSDSAVVGPMVSSAVQGMQDNGISACLKHFPGIGDSTEDTHEGLAETSRTAEEFRAHEFSVFQAGIDAGADFVMVSHMAAPGLTGDKTPSVFSKTIVTDVLRGELGFEGVIITDALDMGAISLYYTADEAAVKALKAGCDMLLMPEDFKVAYEAVIEAVKNGTISEERINDSLRRIYRIKYADKIIEEDGFGA